jgi:endonuclease YncB( thermonuclease family)
MPWAATLVMLVGCSATVVKPLPRHATAGDPHHVPGAIVLNGERSDVRWSDGDSFTFMSGPFTGRGTRLVGFNTLEAYGPVHRWGSWTREELFALAQQGAGLAAAKSWDCTTDGQLDSYDRVLVDCPTLSLELVRQGHAVAYAVKGRPAPVLLEAMHQAQQAQLGLWAKGVPRGLITSLHSMGEDSSGRFKNSSNRVLNTRTGEARLRWHTETYATCQEVCLDTEGDLSCMVYVPFERRYTNQPPCLTGQ